MCDPFLEALTNASCYDDIYDGFPLRTATAPEATSQAARELLAATAPMSNWTEGQEWGSWRGGNA